MRVKPAHSATTPGDGVIEPVRAKIRRTRLIALPFFLGSLALFAGDEVDHREVPGSVLEIRTIDSKRVETPVIPGTLHWHSLVSFQVAPKRKSASVYQLRGSVVSNNTGAPSEGVPIYFGSDLHHPRLAGSTDRAGNFRFTVRRTESDQSAGLRASALENGKIYLDGESDRNGTLASGLTRAYSLEEIMAHQQASLLPPRTLAAPLSSPTIVRPALIEVHKQGT